MLFSFGIEDLPSDGSREPTSHITDIDGLLNLTQSFRKDLSHFQGDKSAKSLLLCAEGLADLTHDITSKWHGNCSPLFLGIAHQAKGMIVVLDGGSVGLSDKGLVCRVDGLEDC